MKADHLCSVCLTPVWRAQQVTCSRACASVWSDYDPLTRQAMVMNAEEIRLKRDEQWIAEERRPEIERLKAELAAGPKGPGKALLDIIGRSNEPLVVKDEQAMRPAIKELTEEEQREVRRKQMLEALKPKEG